MSLSLFFYTQLNDSKNCYVLLSVELNINPLFTHS